MTKPNLILIGIQGSGKGTQAERLKTRHGYQVIGAGTIFREHVRLGDALGERVRDTLREGELVDDELTEEIVSQALRDIPPVAPILLDGVPRTIHQVEFVESLFQRAHRALPVVLFLEIEKAVVLERLARRGRTDDTPEVIATRFRTFEEYTVPVVEYFEKLNRVMRIPADDTPDTITRAIEEALGLEKTV